MPLQEKFRLCWVTKNICSSSLTSNS